MGAGKEACVSIDANRAVVCRFVEEVLGRGDFAALTALAAPDCADRADAPGATSRPEAIAHLLATWRAAFPDLRLEIDELVAAGDRVAARWTLRGTHHGAFLGLPPTGRRVAVAGTELYRLAGGQIIERSAVVDIPGLLRQLGAPAPHPAGPRASGRRPLGRRG